MLVGNDSYWLIVMDSTACVFITASNGYWWFKPWVGLVIFLTYLAPETGHQRSAGYGGFVANRLLDVLPVAKAGVPPGQRQSA